MSTTNTTTEAAEMTETWKPAEHRVDQRVELKSAPDIRSKGRVYSPYSVWFEFHRTDDGPWTSYTTIYCSRINDLGRKALVGTCLRPKQLDEVPDWLADLIARATPPES